MQSTQVLLFALVCLAGGAGAGDVQANPLGKVLELLDGLATKVTKEGEAEGVAYRKYHQWCSDASNDAANDITTASAKKEKLEAQINELNSDIEVANDSIEGLVAAIAKASKELDEATVIRTKESKAFKTAEAELVEGIDTLSRAISVVAREMAKNPAAFVQANTKSLAGMLTALSATMDAAAFSSQDRQQLLAFVQSQQGDDGSELDADAPKAASYASHSSDIVSTLEDMKDKADEQLAVLRRAENNSKQNFAMLELSLKDKVAADNKGLKEQKADKAGAEEALAAAEGELKATLDALAAAQDKLKVVHADCIQVAADHENSLRSRKEELNAIAEARKVLSETTQGAEKEAYSFLQVAEDGSDAQKKILSIMTQLSESQKSSALSQLASRVSTVFKFGGSDVFGKVKSLIEDLIAKLEGEASADADEKAYCDEYTLKTEQKKTELEEDEKKLTAKIDESTAKSASLKGEVAELQKELSSLAKEGKAIDQVRAETHAVFVAAKAGLEEGIAGVNNALSVLRDYYANAGAALLQGDAKFETAMTQPAKPTSHAASDGAGGSIINILEVVQADFSKQLADIETQEADEQSAYEQLVQENKVLKASLDADVKYQSIEFTSLDKSIVDNGDDRTTVNQELDAVNEFYGKLQQRCIAKPEGYAERARRRQAEIDGLKEALDVLSSETAFVQRKMRGSAHGSLAM